MCTVHVYTVYNIVLEKVLSISRLLNNIAIPTGTRVYSSTAGACGLDYCNIAIPGLLRLQFTIYQLPGMAYTCTYTCTYSSTQCTYCNTLQYR